MTDRPPPKLPPLPPLGPRPPAPEHSHWPAQAPAQRAPQQQPRPAAPPQHRADPRARHKRPARSATGAFGYVGLGLVGLALVAGAGIGYLALNPPIDLIREQVVQQVKARTGRDLTIGGPARLVFYPAIGVSLSDVALSAPPEMGGEPLVAMKELDVTVKLLPLFGRRIEVDRLVLRDPVIALRTDASGRRSWDMALGGDAPRDGSGFGTRRITLAQAATPGRMSDALPAAPPATLSGLQQMSLRDVRIDNGTLNWVDERSGAMETVSAINLDAGMDSISGPITLDGHLGLRGERLDIKGTVHSLQTLLSAEPARLVLDVKSRMASVGFDGTATSGGGVAATGALNLNAADIKNFARLIGLAIPPDLSQGGASATGKLTVSGPTASLDEATIAFGPMTATGSLGVDARRTRPLIRANLEIDELPLDSLMLVGAAAQPAELRGSTPAGDGHPASIEDLLNRPASQVRGFTQRSGWSEEPIQLAALGAADADVKLKIGKARYRDIKIGASRVAAVLQNRILKTTIEDTELYSGRGKGSLTLDGTAALPRLTLSLDADGVAALPFLTDAARMKWLSGRTKVALAVAGQGGSQKALMESLAGNANLTFADGAIVGWNIPQIFRGLRQGQITGFERVDTAKTDFSELASTWTISQGVAHNQDLRLVSPLLRVTGAGQVLLAARQIDYQLRPKLVASLDGQGGAQGLSGLEVPLRVKGAWEDPEIQPEIGDILKDPDKALGAVKEIGKQFKGKSPSEIVDQVLGNNPAAAKKANDFLGKLLRN